MTKNAVCDILGIEKPVIQGPMSWITSAELVAAVSNAGGLGVLGINAGFDKKVTTVEETVEEMRKTIRKTRELTDKPIGINVFPTDKMGFTNATLKLCKEEGINILVCCGKVVPEDIKNWKKDGFIVIYRESNPTIKGALEIEKAGADILVATGCDEGGYMPGHVTGTTAVVALLSEVVSIPVVAAGGIVNEKLARASAVVGAQGAFVGTRFILSKECRVSQAAKDDILETSHDDMIVLDIFGGNSRCRTTPTKIAKDALQANKKGNQNPQLGNFYDGILKGNLDAGINSISSVAPLIKSIDSCEDIVNEIARGYEF